jgi:DNA-binding transcriptional LysR family regulator
MNFKVLKTFCDAVDCGSFSRAAQLNGVTQSAVSQQLAGLERELSSVLLNRGRGMVVPTEAGNALYQGAQEILRLWERTLGQLRSASDEIRGVVRVGTIYSVGFDLLYPYVRRFLRDYPEVNLQVEYTRWSRINAAVISGEMDLGVVAYPRNHRSLEIIPFTDQELGLVCAPSHRLARRSRIQPAALRGEQFVAFEPSIPTQAYIDKVLRGCRVKVDVVMAFDNIETLKRAVEVDAGVSILPVDNVTREVAAGLLAYVRFQDRRKWVRRIGIIRRVGKAATPAERALLELLSRQA